MIGLIEKSRSDLAGEAQDRLALAEAAEGDEEELHLIFLGRLCRTFCEVERDRRSSTKKLIFQMARQSKFLARSIELK